jgi:hypothetical protein
MLWVNTAGATPVLQIYDTTSGKWMVAPAHVPVAPTIRSVTVADVAGGGRFTSTSFPVSVDMTEDGQPVSVKSFKAKVAGSLLVDNEIGIVESIVNSQRVTRPLHFTATGTPGSNNNNIWDADPNTYSEWAAAGSVVIDFGFPIPITSIRAFCTQEWDQVVLYFRLKDATGATIFDGGISTIALGSAGTLQWLSPQTPIPAGGVYAQKFEFGWQYSAVSNRWIRLGQLEVNGAKVTEGVSWTYDTPQEVVLKAGADFTNFVKGNVVTKKGAPTVSGTAFDVKVPDRKLFFVGNTAFAVGDTLLGPPKAATGVSRYCVLNGSGNVTGLTATDPGFVAISSPYHITFPATLPDGNPPDTTLQAGVTLTVEAQARNSEGTVTATSTAITPA